MDRLTQNLEQCWDPEKGFLGQLRDGHFSRQGCEQMIDLLLQIKSSLARETSKKIDRNVVRLLWYIPPYWRWQKDFLLEKNQIDPQEYENDYNRIVDLLSDIFEVP